MNSPLLSIVIATHNAAATLERCLLSVLRQTFKDWELIIVDGGSADGTIGIIRQHAESLAYWHSHPDSGIYDAWNQALVKARGEFVCFLGGDDAWHDASTLTRVFNAIDGCDYDLVTGRGILVGGGRPYHEFGSPWNYHKVMRRMTICHPGALHRRELFHRYGEFDTSYRICADYDFLLRLPADIKAFHLNIPLVDVAEGGISRNRRWLMLRERYRAQANCPHVGHLRAAFNYVDKLWRIPLARALGIPN